MNRALKTGTNLSNGKKYTMTNMRQISKVPAMNSFCLQLKEKSAFTKRIRLSRYNRAYIRVGKGGKYD